jgi:hypothetical protein
MNINRSSRTPPAQPEILACTTSRLALRTLVTALLFTFAASSNGASIDTAPAFTYIAGAGNFSCGDFIEYKQSNNAVQDRSVVEWVWGFLAAYNLRSNFGVEWHRLPTIDNLPDEATVLLFLETHCRQHPTDTVLMGTLALIKELHGRVIDGR